MSFRQNALPILVSKTVVGLVACLVWSMGWPESWAAHERLSMLLQILTFISAAAAVWLRIEQARDAWRRGYRSGREEALGERGPHSS